MDTCVLVVQKVRLRDKTVMLKSLTGHLEGACLEVCRASPFTDLPLAHVGGPSHVHPDAHPFHFHPGKARIAPIMSPNRD